MNYFDLMHPADQLVTIMERIYGYGMTTTSGGNLSILDDNGDVWITPGGIDKGTLTRKDMIQIKPDGTLAGKHRPSVELPFHQHIYKIRPDIKAIIHAHPPALVSFSIVRKIPDTRMIPNVHQICGTVGMAEYAVPGSNELGQKIADVFSQGFSTVMLENHGVVVGSDNLFKAFMAFETLDFCARIEIEANRIGKAAALDQKYIDISKNKQTIKLEEYTPDQHSSEEKEKRREMCEFIKRAYNQKLFTSSQGTFSQRLEDGSFLITPYMQDRKYLDMGDIVKIKNLKTEAGKVPSRSVMLHHHIYRKHSHINSIMIAHPPNIMAFAITDCEFDSRTIPESYILLKNVKKIPFGSTFMQPELTADIFDKDTPVILVENDCIIVTGNSLLNAFDRLEVAEYSAKAIIAARVLGGMIQISDEEVDEINRVFNL